MLLDELANRQLVNRVHNRPQEAHGDRLDPQAAKRCEHLKYPVLVEWSVDKALGINPFGYLKGEAPRHVRLGILLRKVEGIETAAFPAHQDFGKAFGYQQRL